MSTISALSSTTATASTGNAFADMSSEEFVNVLINELQNQDPFNPQDTSALLEQLSTLRNIEAQMSLEDSLGDLVLQNQVASAGNLIGKLVAGNSTGGSNTEGLVTSVRVIEGKVYLELDNGLTMNMNNIHTITEATGDAVGLAGS